jgi:hypothetical protein
LGLFLGVKRKLDFELAKGSFWRKADIRSYADVSKVPMAKVDDAERL